MKQITVKQDESVYKMSEDGDFLCAHNDVWIEEACCFGRDSDGLIACGCQGLDSIVCNNNDCTGLEEWEVETLMENI
jgi:hypothetical protein